MKFKQTTSNRAKQIGSLMIEVSLALLISALAAIGTLRESMRADLMRNADIEADTISSYRLALQQYTEDAYQDIQRDLPVTRNGVTLPVGNALGQSMQPTVAQLIAMNYLTANFPLGPLMSEGGTFQNIIAKSPAGCVTIACNIVGQAWVSTPYYIRGTEATTKEVNSPVVSQILTRLGGYGGTSIDGATANLISPGGVPIFPNPVGGAPAGVIGASFGYNAAMLLTYVRIGDLRDPQLAGNFTVAGNTKLNGATTDIAGNLKVVGTTSLTGATTMTGPLTANGAATFNSTATINGATTINNSVNVTGPSGSVTASGNVRADTLIANGIYIAGNPCPNDGAIAKSTTGMLICNAGQWRPTTTYATPGGPCLEGTTATGPAPANIGLLCVNSTWRGMDTIIYTGVENAACPVEGRIAQTAAGKPIVCKEGFYWAISSLIGRQGVVALNVYSHGTTVPPFSCGGGLQPRLIPMGVIAACSFGVNAACSNATGAFQGTIDASGTVSIVGSDGSTPAGGGTAQLTVASVCSTY